MPHDIVPEDFVLDDPEIQKNPYPYYPVLREQKPVFKTSFGNQPCWVLSRREEISKVLMDPETYSSETTPLPNMLFTDPPEHERLRSMVSHMFTRTAVQPMAVQVRTEAKSLLDQSLSSGQCDIINDFAGPLTIAAMGRLLGITGLQVERLRQSTHRQSEYVFAIRLGQTPSAVARNAKEEMTQFLMNLIETHTYESGGVISILADLHSRGKLTAEEFVSSATLLIVAGHSTTTNLIGNAIYMLAQRPQDLDRMAEDGTFITPFLEEVLRTRPSFHRLLRITTRDVELGGEFIPARSIVRLLMASANLDPAFFREAEHFDPDQKRRMHLAFGQGIHSCLGNWVARMEASAALEVFSSKVATVTLDPANPPAPFSGGTFNEFGFANLTVKLGARR